MLKFLRRWCSLLARATDVIPIVALEELSTLEQCHRLFVDLNVEPYASYRVKQGQGIGVLVVYKTIDAYITNIQHHVQIINKAGHVLPSLCEFNSNHIPLNQFFLTTDGFYQKNLPGTIKQLQSAVIALCKSINEAKHIEYDTRSYNTRLLTPLLDSLRDIGLTLHEVVGK